MQGNSCGLFESISINFAKHVGYTACNERWYNRCELWVPKSGEEVTNATKNVDRNVPLLRFELGTSQILGEAVPLCSFPRIHQVNRDCTSGIITCSGAKYLLLTDLLCNRPKKGC